MPGRLLSNAGRAVRLGVARIAFRRAPVVLRLRVPSPLPELAPPAFLSGGEPALSLLEVLLVLRRAARDPDVAAIAVRMDGPPGGLARATTLRRALAEAAAEKPVVVWAESLTSEELLAASGATRVLVPESGSVMLVGLRYEGVFLKALLEKLGVAPEVVRIGAFKSAGEMLTRETISPEQRTQLEALLDDHYAALVEGIASGRGLAAEAVRDRVEAGPFTAPDARAAGLIDECRYPDEVPDEIRALAPALGDADPLPLVDARVYLALRAVDPGWAPLDRELPGLVYVVARGQIVRGRGRRGVACDTYRRLLDRCAEDERVRAVVLRIDSPGGEVVASDLLWRSVQQLGREKPVVASLGDTAASGGYYVAAAAHAVLAEAGSVTGSIGVVGGKLDLSGLYERLGVGRDGVQRGGRAGLFTEARGFTPEERKVVRAGMESAYERFVGRVAEGRGLARERVLEAAGGRVWSGTAARERGLVDALGGPLEAIAEALRRAELAPDAPLALGVAPRLPRFGSLRDWLRLLPQS
ncbi:MAG: signal peptide peptidase SppA [Myxococcota bacterium]